MNVSGNEAGKGTKSSRVAWRKALPVVLSVLVVPGVFWPNYQFIERNDGGFHYRDYRGSPYDQARTPDEGINQITCPPPQRPICGR